jgi:hypothetical protein
MRLYGLQVQNQQGRLAAWEPRKESTVTAQVQRQCGGRIPSFLGTLFCFLFFCFFGVTGGV